MKATTQTAANRIATAGFNKMDDTAYSVIAPMFEGVDANIWYVAKNDGSDTTYRVTIKPEWTCNCGFFTENKEFGICKHILYIAEEIRIREMEEIAEEAEREEAWEGRGILR